MAFLPLFDYNMDTKDRIKLIMEEQHMTQQVFAEFLQQSPATLSSIFNGRTRPTLNVVDAIKAKIPDISIEWLLYGLGEMYVHSSTPESVVPTETVLEGQQQMINFNHPLPEASSLPFLGSQGVNNHLGVKNTRLEYPREDLKIEEKEPRRVTEIRVYYDDQTYETFVPAKK